MYVLSYHYDVVCIAMLLWYHHVASMHAIVVSMNAATCTCMYCHIITICSWYPSIHHGCHPARLQALYHEMKISCLAYAPCLRCKVTPPPPPPSVFTTWDAVRCIPGADFRVSRRKCWDLFRVPRPRWDAYLVLTLGYWSRQLLSCHALRCVEIVSLCSSILV